ncbi:hypothetical protein ACWOC1_06685 [Enterococcus quebecensis]|uniref:Uncharacterized protein n=1 Tax=Enterococcus quebecensis TaxID=903983 RepID=A0A1E5GRZ2_9ENTE|nr:hypothetical protein [Enterococcus quebecensis]OEG15446.1 hypothetical protein BCR23_08225 [Enterococcus quebecensis]
MIKPNLILGVSCLLLFSGCGTGTKQETQQQAEESSTKSQSVDNEFEELVQQEEYGKALNILSKKTKKEDNDIYYKRGVCFFYLDNYQFALANFRKDRELNGEKHEKIEEMFEKIDNVFDETDFQVTEEMMNVVLKDESEKEKAVIKLYSSDNWRKRQFWFGYFKNKEKETYILFNTETKVVQYLDEKIFAQKFKDTYFVNYEEQRPLFSVNDPSEYSH